MANGLFEVAKNLIDPAAMLRGGGDLAILNGRPVVWAGPQMGWQSPESFFKYVGPQQAEALTGAKSPADIYLSATKVKGFKPQAPAAPKPPAAAPEADGTLTPGADAGAVPPPPPILPPPPATTLPETRAPYPEATIPQNQDPLVNDLFKYLKELNDPERIRQVEEMRLQNLLKSQVLTSTLSRAGEQARYARDIEKANIDAWKERQVAQINANAQMVASLGAATVASFAPPSASALASTLQAAMQPFSNIGVKRG
jgi:hypothetical protein